MKEALSKAQILKALDAFSHEDPKEAILEVKSGVYLSFGEYLLGVDAELAKEAIAPKELYIHTDDGHLERLHDIEQLVDILG